MDFCSEDRAQALQVGAILLFGFLVLGLSLYQTTVVPEQNRGIEFNAYQEAAADLTDLRNDVITAAAGETTGTNVKTGAEYPSRSVFVNPGPPDGRLRTTDARNVTLENVTAVDREAANTRTFVENGVSGRNYSTRDVRFSPNYHVLDAQPMVVTGQQAYRYADGSEGRFIPLSGQTLLQGDRLNLLFVSGDLGAGGSTSTVTTEPVSASTRTVTITGDGGNVVLRLGTPPGISADTWVNNTGESLNASNSRVLDVEADGDRVRIELDGDETYRLKLARVEVRERNDVSDVPDPEPAYVVSQVANGTPTTVNETVDLSVEVRDAYNNPLSGVDVEFTYPDGSTETVTTDEDGIATVDYTPTDSGTKEFTANISDPVVANGEPTTTFTLGVFESADGTGGSADVGTGGEDEWSSDDTEETISTSGGVWSGLENVDRLLLSNPYFSPTKADGSDTSAQSRYFRLVFGVTDGNTTYYMAVTDPSGGLTYTDGSWGKPSLSVIKERPNGDATKETGTLDTAVLDRWYDPDNSTSEPMNLLEPGTYDEGSETSNRKAFRELLTDMKQLLRKDSTDVFIAEAHGRSDLNATPVGQPVAYPDEFRDDETRGEPQENESLLPAPSDSKLDGFVDLQEPSGSETLESTDNLTGSQPVERNLTVMATYGVKTTGVNEYTLESSYTVTDGSESDIEVRIVAQNGTVLQSEELNETITLDPTAADELRATGDLYVVYVQVARGKVKMDIDYQRVRAD